MTYQLESHLLKSEQQTLKLNNKTDLTIIRDHLSYHLYDHLFSHQRNGFRVCVGNHPRIVTHSVILFMAANRSSFTDWRGITPVMTNHLLKWWKTTIFLQENAPTYCQDVQTPSCNEEWWSVGRLSLIIKCCLGSPPHPETVTTRTFNFS